MILKKELMKFLQQTSVKGISRYFKVEHLNLKLLWACAILTFLSFGFYQSYKLIAEYFSCPKVTFIKEHEFSFKDDLSFPNLQLCNVYPLGLLRDVPYNESVSYYGKKVQQLIECGNCSTAEQEQLLEVREILGSVNGYIQYIGLNKAVNLMKNYSDFMIECLVFTVGSTLGDRCAKLATIEVVPSIDHVACLRIKFPGNVAIFKVSMTFYIDTFQSINIHYNSRNDLTPISSGVVYAVYHQDIKNIIFKHDQTAPPGVQTSVLIQKQIHTRLPKPYGNCVGGMEHYNQHICLNDCVSEAIVKYCNCFTHKYMGLRDKEIDNCLSVEFNQSKLLENYQCKNDAKKRMIEHEECFDCKHSCSEIKYTKEVSYTRWPLSYEYASFYWQFIRSKPYADRFKPDGENLTNPRSADFSSKKDLFNENFVKINFEIDERAYLEYQEIPKYTLFSFLGTLGGALNLWTGITVVVVVEIIEVVVNIVNANFVTKVKDMGKR